MSLFDGMQYLLTDGIDVCATDPVRPCNVILEVDVLTQVHLGSDGGEDEAFLATVWHRELDLTVKSARAQQGRVQSVGTVRCHDHLEWTRSAIKTPQYLHECTCIHIPEKIA